ncbi:hypothetical protein QFZ41_003680 [Luteibacter sp. W1I16]|uniref:hypothetical protein n=1 Tax=Luteibacter sp. W1I16 TaxID=3373922 RepID=UPI003D1A1FCC
MTYRVFRFFNRAEFADAFTRGEVLLSTLSTCRDYTDPERGDPGEAVHGFAIDAPYPPSETELVAMARALAPMTVGHHVSDADCVSIAEIRDAYLVSTTAVFDPSVMAEAFGSHCVAISDAKAFFDCVTETLATHMPVMDARWGPVRYQDRVEPEARTPPDDIGFIKPQRYERQQEVRFLWSVEREGLLLPLTLNIPGIARLTERVS